MKILMVNKFFYIKGGSETYYFALKRMLEAQGHNVIDFSMKDLKNFESEYTEYFVDNVDYNEKNSLVSQIKMASNIIYSKKARDKFEQLVLKVKPDIIHLHIFQHQMSPSILDVAKKYNIPTVYTAHDLKMICLNYKMMHRKHICEDCKDGHLYHCALNKCVKESFSKSCINTVEGYLHKWRKSYDAIDVIITPSLFYKNKFEEFGVASERIIHIPNFLDRIKPEIESFPESKQYYLYFGRLSEEKGILTLIKAAEQTGILLYILGSGPLKDEIEKYVSEHQLENVKLLGFKSGKELINLVGNSKAVIIPSEWYENGPYSVIEALQLGRPIIGAKIGGIPELVQNNGFLFESGNVDELRKVIENIERLNEIQYADMENSSQNIFNAYYTPETHYSQLLRAYGHAQKNKYKKKKLVISSE